MTAKMEGPSFAAWRGDRPDVGFSDWLVARAEPHWSQAVGHRFTRELATDKLSDSVYRRYLIQDYAFIDVLVRVVAYAIAKAPDMPPKSRLAAFLAAVTSEENDYFLRSFTALGVATETWRNAPLGPTASAFQEVMIGAAQNGGYEEVLAVFLPAEWCYFSWARAVAGQKPERFYLREWIELHDNPDFEAFVTWLRGEMDRRGPALPAERQEHLTGLFRSMMALEVAFFDDAYKV